MGRPRMPLSWCVVQDTVTGKILCIEPTAQPSYMGHKRWQVLGRLTAEEDANQFRQFKELGLPCDTLAFMRQAYLLNQRVENPDEIDLSKIEAQCAQIQRETGRTCFGHCKSEEDCQSCRICYDDIHETWELCSVVRILRDMKERAARK